MTTIASVPSLAEVSCTFQQLLKLECCLAQKALALARQSPCGTVTACDWARLLRQQMMLDTVKEALDGTGGYWKTEMAFDTDAGIGFTLPMYLQSLPVGTYEVLEGDIPGEADIPKSVAAYAAILRAALDDTVGGFQVSQWQGNNPLVAVCADGNTLTLWMHPYLAAHAPSGLGFIDDVGGWLLQGLAQATATGQAITIANGATLNMGSTLPGSPALPTVTFQNTATDPATQIQIGINNPATFANFVAFFANPNNAWADYLALTGFSLSGATITASWALKASGAFANGANGNTWSIVAANLGGTAQFSGGASFSDFAETTPLAGGEWPLGIADWCLPPLSIREMYSELLSCCCNGCGVENAPPSDYMDVTGSDGCGCGGDGVGPDYPDFTAGFIR